MSRFRNTLRRLMTPGRGKPSPLRPRKSATTFDHLETRQVLSTVSAPLLHDTIAVDRSFATFDVSYQAAVKALKATATSTAAPTAAGLAAFDSALSTAIGTLNTSVASDLSNLTATGATVAATIDGETATLLTELETAGGKLASSTNKAVQSLERASAEDIRATIGQADKAILADTTTASLSTSSIAAANKAVFAAFEAFYKSIQAAEQSAVTAGTALDSSTVTSAVATLQTSLDSAVSGLGTAFTSSTSNPTSAIAAGLTTLSTALTDVTAPTVGSHASARHFALSIASAELKAAFAIEKSLAAAISGYNHGLL